MSAHGQQSNAALGMCGASPLRQTIDGLGVPHHMVAYDAEQDAFSQ